MAQDNQDPPENKIQQVGAFISIPFVMAVPPVIGWFIGDWLDKKFDTHPYLMYLFLVLGFVAGFRELYRIVKRFGNGS